MKKKVEDKEKTEMGFPFSLILIYLFSLPSHFFFFPVAPLPRRKSSSELFHFLNPKIHESFFFARGKNNARAHEHRPMYPVIEKFFWHVFVSRDTLMITSLTSLDCISIFFFFSRACARDINDSAESKSEFTNDVSESGRGRFIR